jgi:hypothetical protein
MKDPKDPKDPKDLNKQAPSDPQTRRENDQIAEKDLERVSGGAIAKPPPPKP